MRPLLLVLIVVLVGVLTASGGLGVSGSVGAALAPLHVATTLPPSLASGQSAESGAAPAVTVLNMGIPGLAPEMTSISWPISSPSFGYGFSHYELDYSFNNVNWYFKNITSQSTTTLGYAACHACALWVNEFTIDSSPVGPYIESSGEIQDLVQPNNATTWYEWSNGTSVWIDWTNPATYGGNVSFVGYELWESANGSGYSLAASPIYNVSQTAVLVTGLSPVTRYSFYIRTLDSLSDPNVGGLYETNSSFSNFTTPIPLSAIAFVNRSNADVGQSIAFECGINGGIPPYSTGWIFGDGGTANNATANHTYAAPGTYTASCTTDDHSDSASTGGVSITVSAKPTVAAPMASPAGSVLEGRRITFNVSATGGFGGLSYVWAGLPSGCASTNASTLTCTPSGSGTFSIVVTVTDVNRGSARSVALNFKVEPAVLGLPATEGYELVGGIAAVAAAAVLAVLLVRRRGKRGATPPADPSALSPNPSGVRSEAPPGSPGGAPPPKAPP